MAITTTLKHFEQWKRFSRVFDAEVLVQASLEKMTLPPPRGGRRQYGIVLQRIHTSFSLENISITIQPMSTSTGIPWAQYEWASRSLRHNNFQTRGFVILSYLRFQVELVQSVSNQRLYVRKLLHRTAGAVSEGGENDGDEDDHNVFYSDNPPELRVSTCPQALARLPNETYFPKLVGWQQWNGTHWALYTE